MNLPHRLVLWYFQHFNSKFEFRRINGLRKPSVKIIKYLNGIKFYCVLSKTISNEI